MQQESTEIGIEKNFIGKIKNYYKNNKLIIYLSLTIIIIASFSLGIYFYSKQKQADLVSDLYIEAKIQLSNEKKMEAKNILMKVIESNNETYSTLALFLIVNNNLIEQEKKLVELFDTVLTSNKFDLEIRNLIIFKKALIQSNYVDEVELLETLNQLINTETIWKSHALLLLGDYFSSKSEFLKARENYLKILSLPNYDNLHEEARYRLATSKYD